MKKPELLAPAGNLEKLKAAIAYGADAVYFGGKSFGLRALADNFDDQALQDGIVFAHQHGKKAYITVNAFLRNRDFGPLQDFIRFIADAGADGVIVSDPGVFSAVRRAAPSLPIHISTQANTTSFAAVDFWASQGAKRVVLARELSLAEIREIRRVTAIELEVFVHGAMCIAYSGRCFLSHYLTGRDANRGECAQACRWKYHLVEESRPGQYFPVVEDPNGAYIMNAKDLCLLPHLPELCLAGINSLKIEGRMKSVHYVATIVKVYREAIDTCAAAPEQFFVRPQWLSEINKVSHRPYTTGFFSGEPGAENQVYAQQTYFKDAEFVGLVRAFDAASGLAIVEQRSPFRVGDLVEILNPTSPTFVQKVRMILADGQSVESAPHPCQIVALPVEHPVQEFSLLRRIARDRQ